MDAGRMVMMVDNAAILAAIDLRLSSRSCCLLAIAPAL